MQNPVEQKVGKIEVKEIENWLQKRTLWEKRIGYVNPGHFYNHKTKTFMKNKRRGY